MLVWSHYQLMWADEFCALLTDGVPQLTRVIHIQATTPLSLDPLVYNVCAHVAIDVFGAGAFAIRLPSMCGYLLMQICLFYFVRRITSERAATFAMAFPALVGVVSYSVQARPYGLLLGLSALAILCWQTVTRRESNRAVALAALFLSILLVINTHFYGVLLLVPLCTAELFRTMDRRRVDLPVVSAIVGAAIAGILLLIPFAKAVLKFSSHYFETGVNYHFVLHSYPWLLLGYVVAMSAFMQHVVGAVFCLLTIALVVACVHVEKTTSTLVPKAELVFLVTLAALPFFGYVLARTVTKVIDARYILPSIIGLTALLAILLGPLLQRKTAGRVVLALLFLCIVGADLWHIDMERKEAQATMASLVLSAVTKSKLVARAPQPIYVINPSVFFIVSHYSPSADIRSRLTLVYSWDAELLNQHSDHLSRTGSNMRADGIRNVEPYEPLTAHGAERLFLLYHNSWDWSDRALAAAHAELTYLGPAFGGDLVSVRFP